MWAKRRTFYPKEAADADGAPRAAETPRYLQQKSAGASEGEMSEHDFNFIASLGYGLIPEVTREEAAALLPWVLGGPAAAEALTTDDDALARFSQIEYFFVGTDNGQLFLMPLLPPHLTSYVRALRAAAAPRLPEKGVRLLLHRHMVGEPVHAQDHLGTLVASGSADGCAVVSFYHPHPAPLVCIPHPKMIRCVKLWEGSVFVRAALQETPPSAWAAELQRGESAAVYLFTADEGAEVRLWRVDALRRTYVLLHLFVMSPNAPRACSSLDALAREERRGRATRRETDTPAHCLTLDGDERLLVGTEGGAYAWQLSALAWKDGYATDASHPLCWDEARRRPGGRDAGTLRRLQMRAARLANHHVWLRDAAFVEPAMARCAGTAWKPKYGRTITGGMAVGVVSNMVRVEEAGAPGAGEAVAACLAASAVTVSFEGGQVRNDVRLPLCCVEPVAYPLQHLRMAGSACFALATLAPGARVLTGGSDGRVAVWRWRAADEAYVLLLVTEGERQPHRGLGRHFFVLRHPDVFLSCGFDDGLIREWHLYDDPETFMSCERCFSLMPVASYDKATAAANGQSSFKEMANLMRAAMRGGDKAEGDGGSSGEDADRAEGEAPPEEEVAAGVSCGAIFPAFRALFLVGTFDNAVQTYSLSEVQGCTPPANFIYNGLKTVKLPSYLKMDQCYELGREEEEAGAKAP
ncbi:hypothetical protein STCU_06904 [Strigomonas culicis]|uniref:Uncharacterized protein n=1 Tax=Strigomonas culicis TaxID=28005 RepID=S9U2H2_9TRYP|nr:hypothetical protein STCU_08498 [Strigomonas culicis]EPY24987.1 hypothetical protein STCU_06904 [Strigomonas culicis]|eukprot:EPY21766.1 hypothetical protein STCU_08498 [Strigomonas culicis]